MASSKSLRSTATWSRRAASSAASFTTLARSAPAKPGVRAAIDRRSTSGPSFTSRAWMARIRSRPRLSGRSTSTWRSNRPGRSSALSRISGRLVAAMTIRPARESKPSISASIWFSVCSRSSWPPTDPALRVLPIASSSSMKMMHGALAPAWAKRSRTRAAPTPTNISTNSEPDREKNGTPASPATARARRVLPVPGGPTRSTPLGMRPPSFRNFSGVRRKSTISCSSSTASSMPATSSNATPVSASACTRARVLPKLMTLCGPCPSAPGAHPPHHPGPEGEAQDQGEPPDPGCLGEAARGNRLVFDLLLLEESGELRISRPGWPAMAPSGGPGSATGGPACRWLKPRSESEAICTRLNRPSRMACLNSLYGTRRYPASWNTFRKSRRPRTMKPR